MPQSRDSRRRRHPQASDHVPGCDRYTCHIQGPLLPTWSHVSVKIWHQKSKSQRNCSPVNPHGTHASRRCLVLFAGFGVRSDLISRRTGRQPASCIIHPQSHSCGSITALEMGSWVSWRGAGWDMCGASFHSGSCFNQEALERSSSKLPVSGELPQCLWGFRQPLFPRQKHCGDARKPGQLTSVAGNIFCF